MKNRAGSKQVIGLVPAAGRATRLSPLPFSKELYPVGFSEIEKNESIRPKVVSHYLLEKMRLADIRNVFIILRDNKWDIPSYFGDGKLLDMHLAYLMMDLPYGVPFTLDQAYPFVQNYMVALGFPDILIRPDNAYKRIIAKLEESNADIVLGLFPTDRPHKNDMVKVDKNGRICSLHIKPDETQLIYTWQIAVWTPVFSRYMHNYISNTMKNIKLKLKNELYVGDIIHAAIQDNLHLDSVLFKDGACLDIGTPEDLMVAQDIVK